MVTLPPEFVATKYPGYFWNLETQALFSLKVGGELRELVRLRGNRFNHIPWNQEFYQVYHQGRRRCLMVKYLDTLVAADSVIPLQKKDLRKVA